MTPDEIDKVLGKLAERPLPSEASAAVRKARSAILDDLRPIRPLPASWILTLLFACAFATFTVASGLLLGPHGFLALDDLQRGVMFPTLIALALAAAAACSRQMRPAGGSRLGGVALLLALACFPGVSAAIFRGYSTFHFVPEGVPCLRAGLLVALPTAVLITWVLRRGFVLDWSAAGLAGGVLSGLTGVGMLEVHCPNLKAIHIMAWHLGVVVVSAALGFAIGLVVDLAGRHLRARGLLLNELR
jgi:hypothetical protein